MIIEKFEEKYLTKSTFLILLIYSFIYLMKPLLVSYLSNSDNYLSLFEDDFFYYLEIAININEKSWSTFDGITTTNGYHPLWLLVITGLVNIFGKGFALFISVFTLEFLSFALSLILLEKISKNLQLNLWLKNIVILLCGYKILNLNITGMEVNLTIPLILYAIYFDLSSKKNNYFFGLILSLVILSRIDTAILISIFLIARIFRGSYKPKDVLEILIGFTPILLYLFVNYIYFETLTPISGLAKQARKTYYPNLWTLYELYLINFNYITLHALPTLLSIIVLIVHKRLIPNLIKQPIYDWIISILIFSSTYFLLLSIISGWRFWHWYFYPFALCILMLLIILKEFKVIIPALKIVYIGVFVFVSTWFVNHGFIKNKLNSRLYSEAKMLIEFINKNEGIYAMGDRAGLVGFLSKQPLIQIEGLVANKRVLNLITSDSLQKLFDEFKVDYYIGFKLREIKNTSKLEVIEPKYAYKSGNKYSTLIIDSNDCVSFQNSENKLHIYKIKH